MTVLLSRKGRKDERSLFVTDPVQLRLNMYINKNTVKRA